MPECQAFGCTNERGKAKHKSFFQIPNPHKFPDKRDLAIRWLHNIATGHSVSKFVFGKHKVVCEDHFEEWCFQTEQKRQADLVGYQLKRKTLVKDAYPTLFTHRRPKVDKAREARAVKRHFRKETHNPTTFTKTQQPHVKVSQKETLAQIRRLNNINDVSDSEDVLEATNRVPEVKHMVTTAMQTDPPQESPVFCSACQNPVGDVSVIEKLHSYAKPKSYLSSSNKSKEKPDRKPETPPLHSTPLKAGANVNISFDASSDISEEENPKEIDISEYIPSENDSSYSDFDNDQEDFEEYVVDQKKYVVFEACLDQLLYKIPCNVCGSAVDEIRKSVVGSMLKVSLLCISGHMIFSWDSQPLIGKMPAGNLLMSAAVLLSGETYSHISEFFDIFNLQFFSHSVYYDIQRSQLTPVIDKHWKKQKEIVMQDLTSQAVQLAGDGRCDSPGYSAKYCTYSFMDVSSDKIVDFELVQVNQTSSSNAMEKFGFETTLDRVLSGGVKVTDVSTDRHVSIKKLMRVKFKPRE